MVKVLVIDDSALVRQILESGLNRDPEISVVGTAPDVYAARDMIIEKQPDVLTLDIEMPRMDGIAFLKKLMPQYPIPVVVVSALAGAGADATMEAMASGAVEVVLKPSVQLGQGLGAMMEDLREKVKAAASADVSFWRDPHYGEKKKSISATTKLKVSTDKVVAIGASTGGTVALQQIITALPPDFPGTVVVQHMPAGFTKLFADRLNSFSSLRIKEAEDGDRVMTGQVLIAPGGFETRVVRRGGQYHVKIQGQEKRNGHCPSVDDLFFSVSEEAAANSIGLILTGMGRDGAEGLLAMRKAGARTFSQDKASSIVYGMPKEAWEIGASEMEWGLEIIPSELIKVVNQWGQVHAR